MSRAITAQELSMRISIPATLPTRHDVPNIAISSSQPLLTCGGWSCVNRSGGEGQGVAGVERGRRLALDLILQRPFEDVGGELVGPGRDVELRAEEDGLR